VCTRGTKTPILECFHNEQLFMVQSDPGNANIMNYVLTSMIPEGRNKYDRDRFLHLVKFYIWDDRYFFKYCSDQIVRRCIADREVKSILSFCHDQVFGGHFSEKMTSSKVLHYGFYCPILLKDANEYC